MQRPEIFTRDVGLEKNDRLGTMHNSDQFGIIISGFTPSCEALGRLLQKKKKMTDENANKWRRGILERRGIRAYN